MARINSINLPRQRLSYNKKGKQWRKDNIDYADRHSFYNNENVRKSIKNKIINQNLYNGIVDIRDLTAVVNPYQMDASYIPDNIPHHPIIVPKIDLLIGEEIKRRFDWRVLVTNHDAITQKENDKKQFIFEKLQKYLQENNEEEELKQKLADLEKYMKYEWQDLRERMGTQILKYYWKAQNFEEKFNELFKHALIFGEEIAQIDIVGDEPFFDKLNPIKVHSIRSGNSDKIEDSSLIILEDHWSPARIVDHFHEQLKPSEIDYIMEYTTSTSTGSYTDDHNNHVLLRDGVEEAHAHGSLDAMFQMAEINGHYFSNNYTDENGNIRVLRVYWKSLKKIKKVKYYDEFGETQYKIRSEEYIPNENEGEEVTDLWVNEWWEGTKIGKDVYVQMKPRPVQFNKLNNPSYCHPGIVGQVYNTNQGKAVSLVDRCKNYQYMYDAIWDRLNKAIATNYGKIFELDLAKVPDNWEIEKWLHFAITNKIAVVDSFKEGNKGASTGKLAGGMNSVGGRAIDMETGNYIQQHINLLEFIKMEMSEIAGVSKQREGQISNRETVGGVERSVNQSSHITEWWFNKHENFKLRVLEIFLETAKYCLKGNNKKVQYILDDLTTEVLNFDDELISEADYGLVLANSGRATELEQTLKQHAQAFMQNGGSMTAIMDIFFSDSLVDMRRKIEDEEEKINERNSKQAEEANKVEQERIAAEADLQNRELDLKDIISQREDATKRYIAELKELQNKDVNEDGIIDSTQLEEIQIKKDKIKKDHLAKMKQLDQDMVKHKDKMQREDKKIKKMNNSNKK